MFLRLLPEESGCFKSPPCGNYEEYMLYWLLLSVCGESNQTSQKEIHDAYHFLHFHNLNELNM